jgi:hypothetical protein
MKIIWIVLVMGLTMTSCAEAQESHYASTRIIVGAGPEDMVIDSSGDESRLLISCSARREGEPTFGEIVSYTPSTGIVDTLVRSGTPDSLFFQPHGIYLNTQSDPHMLYAISHEHEEGFHPIYIWEVRGDTLIFRELVSSPLLHSPNALCMGVNGELYIVNDSGKRGSLAEKILKLNRANIVCMTRNPEGNWQGTIAAEKLGYPAGINRIGNRLFAGDAIHHQLHVYEIGEGGLIPQEPIKGLRGNDNIRIKDEKLYLTGHVKPFKFIKHVKSSENKSPVEAWRVNPVTGESETLFYTDGSLISAGSTAVVIGNSLYISQVFDPFILCVKLPDPEDHTQ